MNDKAKIKRISLAFVQMTDAILKMSVSAKTAEGMSICDQLIEKNCDIFEELATDLEKMDD
jgi:hypothetical protein